MHQALDFPVWPAVLSIYLHVSAISLAMPFYSEILLTSNYSMKEGASEQLGRTQVLLSLTLVCNAGFELLSSGLLGVLCDRLGRKPIAIMSQVGQFIDFSVASLCCAPIIDGSTFVVDRIVIAMVIARSVAGLFGNMRVPVHAYVGDVSTPTSGPRNFSLIGIASGVALISGPAIASIILANTPHIRVLLFTAANLSLLNIAFIACKWPWYTPDAKNQVPWLDASPYHLLKSTLLKSRSLLIFGVLNFLDAFCLHMIFAAFPLFTKKHFGWGPRNLTAFFLCIGLGVPVQVGFVLRMLLRYLSEFAILQAGYIASCLAFFLFFVVGLGSIGWLAYPIVVVLTFGLISNPIQTALAVREVPREELGRLSGAYSIMETSGKLVAPVVAASAMNATIDGEIPSAVFLISCLFIIPGIMLSFIVPRYCTQVANVVLDVHARKDEPNSGNAPKAI